MYCFDIRRHTQEVYDGWVDPRKRALAGRISNKRRRRGNMEKVYLAGKISGDPGYREKFAAAARELREAGFTVLNPALLPDGFEYDAYMRMSGAMLAECEAVCFLPDWMESAGSLHEAEYAAKTGKRIFMYEDWKAKAEYLKEYIKKGPKNNEQKRTGDCLY